MLASKFKLICLFINSLSLLLITTSTYANSSAILTNSINHEFYHTCNKQHFSGAVLIAINGQIIFQRACGLANRNFNIPNDINTKFNLGSVSKLFTSIAIAQLIQQRRISLTTSLDSVLPSWLPKKEAKKITIGQLLIHTTGLGNFMDDKRWQLGADAGLYVNISDYKQLLKDNKLLFHPGESQLYSNNGYLLLGGIIERLTRISYPDYLSKEIFSKAGMKETGIYRLDDPVKNRAEGYILICKKNKCYWKNNNYEAPFVASPAGGAYSTLTDLFKFSEALHHCKLLNSDMTHEVLSINVISPSSGITKKLLNINNKMLQESVSHYGFAGTWNKYGFAVWDKPFLVGHTGGTAGASAFFATSPNNKYTIIILSNTSGSAPIILYKKIRILLGFSPKIMNY